MSLPILRTERLLLRGFTPADAPRVREIVGSREVAATTLNMPYPCEDGMAEAWIAGHAAAWEARKFLVLAIIREPDELIGEIELSLALKHRRAEAGSWIGAPFWNRGFALEAARAVLAYGFGELGLHCITANCFSRNAASARVLRKLGMRHEGTLREHVWKWDRFEDVETYAILEDEWRSR
jgi:RimJ/RimL family protein N-acetyltransferase